MKVVTLTVIYDDAPAEDVAGTFGLIETEYLSNWEGVERVTIDVKDWPNNETESM